MYFSFVQYTSFPRVLTDVVIDQDVFLRSKFKIPLYTPAQIILSHLRQLIDPWRRIHLNCCFVNPSALWMNLVSAWNVKVYYIILNLLSLKVRVIQTCNSISPFFLVVGGGVFSFYLFWYCISPCTQSSSKIYYCMYQQHACRMDCLVINGRAFFPWDGQSRSDEVSRKRSYDKIRIKAVKADNVSHSFQMTFYCQTPVFY